MSPAQLVELAAAIADGTPIDWSQVGTSGSDVSASIADRIRLLERIAQLHASLPPAASFAQSLHQSLLHPAPTEPGTSDAPVTWGPLTIVEKIGRGTFGDVYRARDSRLDRPVALKLLRHKDRRESAVIHEGQLLARVRHPNVVTVYGAERIEGRVGLWMEFIEGRTLEEELKERRALAPDEVRRVGLDLARALGAVHRAGLLHRDLKAQNVMRDTDGRVLLTDFGAGRELSEKGLQPGHELAGTPLYMAPEVLEGHPASVASDIYSLGVLLFHLATGSFPVTGRSLRDLRDAHARGARVPLRSKRTQLHRSVVSAIDRAVDPDAAGRYPSAAALESALATAGARWAHPYVAAVGATSLALVLAGAGLGVSRWRQAATAGPQRGDNRGGSAATTGPASLALAGTRNLRQISRDSDLAGPGAPSPDGRLLSFTDWDTGDLAIHEIATGTRWHVTSNGPTDATAWSEAGTSRFTADGLGLLYVWYERRDDHQYPEIRWIAVTGGAPRTIWRAPVDAFVILQHWAGDDRLILVGIEERRGTKLVLISPHDGTLLHSIPTGPALPNGASLSPDGRYVAFDKEDPTTGLRDVFVTTIDGQFEHAVVRDPSNDHTPVWTKDGHHLLFLSDRSGPTGLWSQRVDNDQPVGIPVRIEPNLGRSFFMGLTDDNAYFVRRRLGTRDVYLANLDAATGAVAGEPFRAGVGVAGADEHPEWSPDGRYLAFSRGFEDRSRLVVKSLADGRERELVNPAMNAVAKPRWEPGGQTVLMKAMYRHEFGLYRVNVDTEAVSTVMRGDYFNDYELLPGGRSIIYAVRGRRSFIRRNLVSGREEVLLRVEPPWNPYGLAVSRSGERLAYVGRRKEVGTSLFVLDLDTSRAPREVLHVGADEGMVAYIFTADGSEVIVSRWNIAPGPAVPSLERGGTALWAVDVHTGHARLLGLNVNHLNAVRLSPDGRQLSYDAGAPFQEVWVLENALSGLD